MIISVSDLKYAHNIDETTGQPVIDHTVDQGELRPLYVLLPVTNASLGVVTRVATAIRLKSGEFVLVDPARLWKMEARQVFPDEAAMLEWLVETLNRSLAGMP